MFPLDKTKVQQRCRECPILIKAVFGSEVEGQTHAAQPHLSAVVVNIVIGELAVGAGLELVGTVSVIVEDVIIFLIILHIEFSSQYFYFQMVGLDDKWMLLIFLYVKISFSYQIYRTDIPGELLRIYQ